MPVNRISPDDVGIQIGMNKGRAISYPSPYFDLSQTYFPASIKELFQYCIYFYNTHCIVPAVVNKLASYPITELVFATAEDKAIQNKWKHLFVDILNLPFELFQIGIDQGVYGNTFIGVYFPFKRYMHCPLCSSSNPMSGVKGLKVKGAKLEFVGTCPSCKKLVTFSVKDKYIRNPRKIRLIRYDPMAIDIIADPISGNKVYVWDPPSSYKDAIKKGEDLDLIEAAPKVILDAIKDDKRIIMNQDTFFHMRRPSISGQNSSWGFPLIMHALKSLYYLQILKRAQEAIAHQHIIPLWFLYPASGNGGSSLPPAASIGLGKWKTQVENELAKWRKDPNYIPIVNFPIGFQAIGGEGRALLLAPEIQQEIQQVIASMSVPQEFVFGGLTWTGSSITLRMLENSFQGTRDGMQRFIKFLVNILSKYLKYKPIDIYMSELKMADDVQRQQIAMNLEATGRISETRLLSEFGYDFSEEKKLKQEEFAAKLSGFIRDGVLQARAQGEASLVSLDYQIQGQKKQILAEGDMMVAQAKSQAEAQQQLADMGLAPVMPPMGGDPAMGGQPPVQGEQPPVQGYPNAAQPPTQGAAPPPTAMYADPAQQQLPYDSTQMIDEVTGLPIDPQYGLPVDPESGFLIDVQSGTAVDSMTGNRIDLATGQMIPAEEYAAMSMQGTSLAPGQSAGMGTSLQPKTASLKKTKVIPVVRKVAGAEQLRQEESAKAGLSTGAMPPGVKAMVTRFANDLLSTDAATQNQVLTQMSAEQPTLAMLVKQRMAEMTSIEGAIPSPKPPKPPTPAGLKPITNK